MPVEPTKEVAKLLVETSGVFGAIWQWLMGAMGVGLVALWGHITGRVSTLEKEHVKEKTLREHIEDENERFKALFEGHDKLIDKVSDIAASVARIEGKLDR